MRVFTNSENNLTQPYQSQRNANALEVKALYTAIMSTLQSAINPNMSETQTQTNGHKTEVQPKIKRPKRQLPALPSVASAADMVTVAYECKVDGTPFNWDDLPVNSSFSLSPDGSYLKIKVSKSRFCDLRSGRSTSAGSGRCYRVFF